jgi:hypothetical protein
MTGIGGPTSLLLFISVLSAISVRIQKQNALAFTGN